jgi:hypothetical protein
MKLDIWVDGILEITHVLSFLPILKKYWLPWQQIGLKHCKYNNICDWSKRAEIFL